MLVKLYRFHGAAALVRKIVITSIGFNFGVAHQQLSIRHGQSRAAVSAAQQRPQPRLQDCFKIRASGARRRTVSVVMRVAKHHSEPL